MGVRVRLCTGKDELSEGRRVLRRRITNGTTTVAPPVPIPLKNRPANIKGSPP